jgi:hypothetical protein
MKINVILYNKVKTPYVIYYNWIYELNYKRRGVKYHHDLEYLVGRHWGARW